MPGPAPKEPLVSHCSVVFNGTLYTYSATAFQSLRLAKDAQWELLPSGVSTTGSECVHGHQGTPQEALYIVGGTTTTTNSVFKGLQRWSFIDRKWESLELPVPVTLNLINHGATFLETSQQIITFSGTTWPDTSTPSADTYLIKMTTPFEITSLPAADPVLAPLVLPWGKSGALVLGGDERYTTLKTFELAKGWSTLGAKLLRGLPSKGKAAVSLMQGDDGSRMLLVFDMTTTPTSVMEQRVKDANASGSKRRRQQSSLTQDNWPTYNGTLAPQTTRSGFSLAYEGDLVVISGGGAANDPLCIFNARKNEWVNTTEFFGSGSLTTESTNTAPPGGTNTAHPTSPSTATTTGTVGSSGSSSGGSSKLSTVQLLFVILGSVIGVALLLSLILFLLKRRRRRENGGESGTERSGARMSFQDRGALFVQEDDGPLPAPRRGLVGRSNSNSWVHVEKAALASSSSQSLSSHGGPSARPGSKDETPPIPVTAKPGAPLQPSKPPPRAPISAREKERGSGWSDWFSGPNSTTLPQRTYSAVRSSGYTDATVYPTPQQGTLHTNPYLHNAGIGVIAGGGSVDNSTGGTAGTTTTISGGMVTTDGSTHLQRTPSKGLVLQDPPTVIAIITSKDHNLNPTRPLRRESDTGTTSSHASSFSSSIPSSADGDRITRIGWAPADKEWGYARAHVASSVYPESVASHDGIADSRRNTGLGLKPGTSVDNLGWLNLRHS